MFEYVVVAEGGKMLVLLVRKAALVLVTFDSSSRVKNDAIDIIIKSLFSWKSSFRKLMKIS